MSKTTYEVVIKAVTWFVLIEQVRRQATAEADVLLTESIRQHGVLQPVGVRPDGKLVWGHRRLRCAIAAGRTEVPAVVLNGEMTEGEFIALQMQENVQRADLSAYDLWQGCVRLQATNPGWQLKDVAKALALDPSTITRIMSPSKCTQEWQDALRDGKVGISDCYAASKLPQDKQAGLLALKLSGASRDQIEAAGKKARAAPADTIRLARVRCPLSTGTVVTVQGAEMDLEALIEALQSALEAARKANKDSLDVRTAEKVWRDRAKATA